MFIMNGYTILENEARRKFELVPLPNNVIQSRIADVSLDILEQGISQIKVSPLENLPKQWRTRLPMFRLVVNLKHWRSMFTMAP